MKKNIEVSVVIPCLNEEQGIAICVKKCLTVFNNKRICGEVVVSDNGSTDRSVLFAKNAGARVVHQPKRGYGNAYLKGFSEASGKYIIMADADDTYDFSELYCFVEKLRQGYEYVSGNRLNKMMKAGAMPWSHRWIGNPVLTFLLNLMFQAHVSDAYCGMRGMTKLAYEKMNIRSTGWEFALEMAIKASKYKLNTTDVLITYYPRKGESKLNTFSDGWRSFRFMLLFSPLYLFVIPGLLFILMAFLFQIVPLLMGHSLFGSGQRSIDTFMSTLLVIVGYQIISFGFTSKLYAINNSFDTSNKIIDFLFSRITLEDGLLLGLFLLIIGIITSSVLIIFLQSSVNSILNLKIGFTALTLIVIGIQTIFSSFFLSLFGLKKK